ncbi:hypothetical protein [Methanobrevibacter sp.]|uniref:hypothetical protein n=1 Tax=Methanobrevibacter sp. TaxID=66852 RepID=UPI0038906487
MKYNNIIIILVVLLAIVVIAGAYFVFNNNNSPADNLKNSVNNTTSSNVSADRINTEEVQSQSSSSNTHVVMGADGHYLTCDDNGNILEDLGPSKKYYPNDPSAVDYPDAESYSKYSNGKP